MQKIRQGMIVLANLLAHTILPGRNALMAAAFSQNNVPTLRSMLHRAGDGLPGGELPRRGKTGYAGVYAGAQ